MATITFRGAPAATGNEPVIEFKNGRAVTYKNAHAYYKAWYSQLGITDEQADECATAAVARLRPKR